MKNDKSFKVVGLEELSGKIYPRAKEIQSKKTKPFQKFINFILKIQNNFSSKENLQLENAKLQTKLIGALEAAHDAGKVGLKYFHQVGNLEAQIDILKRIAEPSVFNQVWVRKEELDKVKHDLNVMTARCHRFNHQFDDMNTMRINAEMKLIELTKKLGGLP